MTEVQVLRRKNGLMLVEWNEAATPKRAWVSGDMLRKDNGDTALVDKPQAGVPYGVDFWRMVKISKVTPEQLDAEMKRRGIWTLADLRANPNVALAAIQSLFGLNLSALLMAADQYEQELKEK